MKCSLCVLVKHYSWQKLIKHWCRLSRMLQSVIYHISDFKTFTSFCQNLQKCLCRTIMKTCSETYRNESLANVFCLFVCLLHITCSKSTTKSPIGQPSSGDHRQHFSQFLEIQTFDAIFEFIVKNASLQKVWNYLSSLE